MTSRQASLITELEARLVTGMQKLDDYERSQVQVREHMTPEQLEADNRFIWEMRAWLECGLRRCGWAPAAPISFN